MSSIPNVPSMESLEAIEYARTAAAAATNSERILRSGILKSHSPFDSSFDSDNDQESSLAEQQRRINSNSPPPKCAICLCRCHNKCFTDSCLHQFCFNCLLEWSKIKPECPLCKQNFKSIIHDVKSIDNFKEYQVRPLSTPMAGFDRPPTFFSALDYDLRPSVNVINLSRRQNVSQPVQRRIDDALQDYFMIRSTPQREPSSEIPPRQSIFEDPNLLLYEAPRVAPVFNFETARHLARIREEQQPSRSISAANRQRILENMGMGLNSMPLMRRRHRSVHEGPVAPATAAAAVPATVDTAAPVSAPVSAPVPVPAPVVPAASASPAPAHSSTSSVFHRLDFLLAEPPRFTYSATLQVRPQQTEAIRQLLLTNQSSLTERYLRLFPNDSIPIRQHAQEWRKYVYERNLYALPLPDVTGRHRECSAAFYRENPAQMHRLIPWLNRELVALVPNTISFRIPIVLEEMSELLPLHDIESGACRRYFQGLLRERTMHFLHEFLNYARSPYDMIGYDRSVEYTPRFLIQHEPQVVDVSSSSDTDEVRMMLDDLDDLMRGSFDSTVRNTFPPRNVGVIVTSTVVNNDSTGDQVAGPSGTSIEQQNSEALGFTRNGTTVQITRNISLSSNSDSEVEFVLERKPPHLRTPEQVNLSELDSDSDVIFVENEAKPPTLIESSNASSDDNKPLVFAAKRFKAESKLPTVEPNTNEEMNPPLESDDVAGPSSSRRVEGVIMSNKYEHKKFFRRKPGIRPFNHYNYSASSSNSLSSSSSENGVTSDVEWTNDDAKRKTVSKAASLKRLKSKRTPGSLKRKRKTKKIRKTSTKVEPLPVPTELSNIEQNNPDLPTLDMNISTSEAFRNLGRKFDQIQNDYKKILCEFDKKANPGDSNAEPCGSQGAGPSDQGDKPKLKSVIIRKNPNYYIKKAPITSSDESD